VISLVKVETVLAAVGDNFASFTIKVPMSPVIAIRSAAVIFDRLGNFLQRLLLLHTPRHLFLLVPCPLFTDRLVELAPVLRQALLGAVLGGATGGASVRVRAALETVVTKLGTGDKLVVLDC